MDLNGSESEDSGSAASDHNYTDTVTTSSSSSETGEENPSMEQIEVVSSNVNDVLNTFTFTNNIDNNSPMSAEEAELSVSVILESSDQENGNENDSTENSTASLFALVRQDIDMALNQEIYAENSDDEEDEFDLNDEGEDSDEIMEEVDVSTSAVNVIYAAARSNNSNTTTDANSNQRTTRSAPHNVETIGQLDTSVEFQRAFSDLILLAKKDIESANALLKASPVLQEVDEVASSSSSVAGTPPPPLLSVPNGRLNYLALQKKRLATASASSADPSPVSLKYDREKFIADLMEAGKKAFLTEAKIKNLQSFSLSDSTLDFHALLENLNWIFGDMDAFFRSPRVNLERLEYTHMVKFTAGDFITHSCPAKIRDRERLLQFKPMEVIVAHCVYFLTLIALKKFSHAHQVLYEMKTSISRISADCKQEFGNVFGFMERSLELFFNHITGRNVFHTDGVLLKPEDWDQRERLYLCLASVMVSDVLAKPLKFEFQELFETMVAFDIFIVEWGLYFRYALIEKKKSRKRNRNFLHRVLQELEKENSRCENPFSTLAVNGFLLEHLLLTGTLNMEMGFITETYRNVLNKHGDIIQVRLQVAKQLQTFPAGPIKQGLIRECLEKAVEINPFHPEANYRLAMLYSSMKQTGSGTVLALKHLKASIAADGSNWDAVTEYSKILLGKNFRLMSEAFGTLAQARKNTDGHKLGLSIDVPSVLNGFTEGIGSKFWSQGQLGEMKLLVFCAFLMVGCDHEALHHLLPIYRNNRVLSGLVNIESLRAKYDWATTKMSVRNLTLIFTDAYESMLGEIANEPSTSTAPDVHIEMKTMITTILSYFQSGMFRRK